MSGSPAFSKSDFVSDTLFKRDLFSETHSGHLGDDGGARVVRRVVTASPLWSRPIAWFLAYREIRALNAVEGIDGAPRLIATDRDGLLRDWIDGTPIQNARPSEAQWYRDAARILREMRRRRITHNDLAKPQNWLMRPDGRAAVIDFQLASVHRRRGLIFGWMAYEDFRHLLKHKHVFAPHLMTPTATRIVARRSAPSRLWLASGKKVYNFVTRRLLHWSDGEGTHDRLDNEGPAIRAMLGADPRIGGVALTTYSLPSKGVGLYAFVETALDEKSVRALLAGQTIELLQPVAALPRATGGGVRADVLAMVALNQISTIEALLEREPELEPVLRPIVANRRNLTDRQLTPPEG